jgi:hypothetical protein
MAADLQQIAYFLDNLGWDYRIDEQEERIITGVESDNVEDFLIVVQLDETENFSGYLRPKSYQG